MSITIHSALNSVLWGLLISVSLSLLSRSRQFLSRLGTAPLTFLAAVCLIRCSVPVEFRATQEIGTDTLNLLYRVISKAADTLTPERQFFRLWAIGAAIGFVLWLPGYTRRILTARRLAKSQSVRMRHFGQQYKVPGLSVAVTSRVYTPCVIGLWRETILLPDTAYRAKQLEMILQHEYCHIKHHDSLLDFFLRILCTVFWWNPGIHICRFVVTRLCDHRCDREVLRHARPSARRYYCKTLLTFASNRPGASGQFAASSLKSRFYLILYSEGEGKRAWVGLVILLMIALCLFTYLVIFQPAYQPESPDYTDYALHNGTISQCEDGSYILKTDQGEVVLDPGIEQDLLADGFRME